MKLKYIINLYGGPGVGKSTIAAGLFFLMKTEKYNVEFVTEYAKELIYEGRYNVLEQDQLYVFAKQHRKILRLKDSVDYIISDSPLLLSSVYSAINPYNVFDHSIFKTLVFNINDQYKNIDILLLRNPGYKYKQEGRFQDLEGVMFIDREIKEIIKDQCPNVKEFMSDNFTIKKILKTIKEIEKNEKLG